MQPVQVNLGGASAPREHGPDLGPLLQPSHSQNVDLANESNLSVGDIGRAASNLWSIFQKSLPWLMGAFGVYRIWQSFESRKPAKSPREAAADWAAGRSSSREPLYHAQASSGPIAGLRNAAMGVAGAAAAAIQDPEKQRPSDPFALRLLKTVTRFAGPDAGTALALEEACPDVIRGSQLLSQGDLVHAGGAFACAFVKTAMTMAAARAGEKAGEWMLGWLPAGKPVGRWLGWVLGSALGERLGNGAVGAMGRIAVSLGAEAASTDRSPEAAGRREEEAARRGPVGPPDIRADGLSAAGSNSGSAFVPRFLARGLGR